MYTYNSGGNFLTNLQNHQMQNEMMYSNAAQKSNQSVDYNSYSNMYNNVNNVINKSENMNNYNINESHENN